MNLSCLYCQTPFTLSMNEKIGALRLMHTENMHHYDAICPHCRRANSVSRERLEMFTPGWQQAIAAPVQSAPPAAGAAVTPKVESAPVQSAPPVAPAAVTPKVESAPAPIASPSKPRHSSAEKKAKAAAKPKSAKRAASKTKPAPSKPAKKAPKKKAKSAVKKSKRK